MVSGRNWLEIDLKVGKYLWEVMMSPVAIVAMVMVESGLKMLASVKGIDLDNNLGWRWLADTKNALKELAVVEIR